MKLGNSIMFILPLAIESRMAFPICQERGSVLVAYRMYMLPIRLTTSAQPGYLADTSDIHTRIQSGHDDFSFL